MTPDELRALADALLEQLPTVDDGLDHKTYCVIVSTVVREVEQFLRQCADQKPVAWQSPDGSTREDEGQHEPPFDDWKPLFAAPVAQEPDFDYETSVAAERDEAYMLGVKHTETRLAGKPAQEKKP